MKKSSSRAPRKTREPDLVIPAEGPRVEYKFKLATHKPQIKNAGGSVTLCHRENFPVVGGNAAAVFYLRLQPGALREPHWHPNAWEFDYMVQGKVRMTVVPPDGVASHFTLEPGDVAFMPQGYTHSIKNIGNVEAVMAIIFNNEMPNDIGLTTMLGGFPTEEFAQTMEVPASALAEVPKSPPGTIFIAP